MKPSKYDRLRVQLARLYTNGSAAAAELEESIDADLMKDIIAADPDGLATEIRDRTRPNTNGTVTQGEPTTEPDSAGWPALEDWGLAAPSSLAEVEYVENLLRPGRILLVAAVEGVGKSYAIDAELGIRLASAGGSFAETWPILRNGPVVTFSEMHRDDDIEYRDAVLASLGLDQKALVTRYWHQNLMLAAGGAPVLTSPTWREQTLALCRELGAITLIIDTATTATGGLEPWGPKILALFHALRVMLAEYPELAIILVVHLRKPTGRGGSGDRQITDVLGDWGKWADAVLLMEDDGDNKTKLTTYKRVGQQRRVIAKRRGGLLVEPMDITNSSKGATKVPQSKVVDVIRGQPGIDIEELAKLLHVAKRTADGYVDKAEREGLIVSVKDDGPSGKVRYFVESGAV